MAKETDGVRYVGIKRRKWVGSITFTDFRIKASVTTEIQDSYWHCFAPLLYGNAFTVGVKTFDNSYLSPGSAAR